MILSGGPRAELRAVEQVDAERDVSHFRRQKSLGSLRIMEIEVMFEIGFIRGRTGGGRSLSIFYPYLSVGIGLPVEGRCAIARQSAAKRGVFSTLQLK